MRALVSSPAPHLDSDPRGLDHRELSYPQKFDNSLTTLKRFRAAALIKGSTSRTGWKACVIHPNEVPTNLRSNVPVSHIATTSMVASGQWGPVGTELVVWTVATATPRMGRRRRQRDSHACFVYNARHVVAKGRSSGCDKEAAQQCLPLQSLLFRPDDHSLGGHHSNVTHIMDGMGSLTHLSLRISISGQCTGSGCAVGSSDSHITASVLAARLRGSG